MTTQDYLQEIIRRYKLGNATEHTYRGSLEQLIESIVPGVQATNEPKRQTCGAPDYILTKKNIPVGFIEAKDIGDKDLEGKKKTGNKEQFDRYRASLDNLIFTDYLDFHLYQDGELKVKIKLAEIVDDNIIPLPQNFSDFESLLKDFCTHVSQTIRSSKRLAEMMAGKARLLSDVIEKTLNLDMEDSLNPNTALQDQYDAFKDYLIHDIKTKGFADIYAQTITYGLFAARLHDPTLDTFSRQEAAELIPKSNPFLRKLFQFVAGYDLDNNLVWIVDNLVDIFLACNVEEILKNYGKSTKMEDPIIHFYETFLAEYDPKLRKARGVWYTPAPVVNFIVRAVDDILKTEFDLPQGLADTTKVKVKRSVPKLDGRSKTSSKVIGETTVEQEVHRVQILDPATGTGTFLAEVIKHIHKKFKGQDGIWSSYVENHLLPRLNGFEILMASYAMAHLQLDLLLKETGFKPTSTQRKKIYLTNSLEESHPDTGTLFANWLSSEANEANYIKRDTPVMCVIGNPPYAVSSTNKNPWIDNLIADYKRNLNEQSYNSLSDDYVKFIRYGQHYIDKNGSGVLAYISNNSFLDGVVFRQMRKNLLESFDKIYILDLHGNSKKKEVSPDGSIDKNVFDIMQGVSINIFIKKEKGKKELGKLYHYDLFGERSYKYDFLKRNSYSEIDWEVIKNKKPEYLFTPMDWGKEASYTLGFNIKELFCQNSSGVETRKDGLTISHDKDYLKTVISDFKTLEPSELASKYSINNNSRDWKIEWAIEDIKMNSPVIREIAYKPLEKRFIIYTGKTKGINGYPMYNNFKHVLDVDNIGLCLMRKTVNTSEFKAAFVSNTLIDKNFYGFQTYFLPLYLYPENSNQKALEENQKRTPNLNQEIVDEIGKKLGLTFTNEKQNDDNSFAPIDILDYIYAVLFSPTYREKYKEFLKIDFPRVPYPKDKATFWKLVKLGGEIRQIHLLESTKVEDYITAYPMDGDNIVTRKLTKKDIGYELIDKTTGKVWINDEQYFDKVPLVAWEFYIGGYQPAQKWLKDRKDRTLEFEDILHYQKIIVALTETDRLMKEIDKIEIEETL